MIWTPITIDKLNWFLLKCCVFHQLQLRLRIALGLINATDEENLHFVAVSLSAAIFGTQHGYQIFCSCKYLRWELGSPTSMLFLTSTEIRTKFSVKNIKLLQILPECNCNTCIKMNWIELPWLYSLKGSCIVLKEIAQYIEKQMLGLDFQLKIADGSILWMVYKYLVIRHNIC